MFRFENGQFAKDLVTGFAGVVTARVDYISGCRQYTLQPQADEKGAVIEAKWFDEDRLVLDAREPIKLKIETNGFGNAPAIR